MHRYADMIVVSSSWMSAIAAWFSVIARWLGLMSIVVVSGAIEAASIVESRTLSDACDMIELNHFHDCLGRHVYDQVIFWRWDEPSNSYHVRAWTMADSYDKIPVRNYRNDTWSVRYIDSEQRLERTVTARHYRESWTQRDPERDNKRILDERERVSLVRRKTDIVIMLSDMNGESQ